MINKEKKMIEDELQEICDRANLLAKKAHSTSISTEKAILIAALIHAQAADKIIKAIDNMTKMLSEKRFYPSF